MIRLSVELKATADELPKAKPADLPEIASELQVLARLAASMERELDVLRLGEASRQGGKALEQLATEQLTHLVRDPEGKVIHHDFGRKP
ncbi:hypothetical protein [Rhizobium halophytocola]|uniref:Uncharacterized protein n=1 Tax=Rhizobium halophytocola TaxID=735519 RepID=A0ABS4E457_9HYPH|nr:hypothetical protein [Rhizobium halophytocola]MBP1852712.1 hypothetical protein [Rhizobium halophytocola]